MYFIHPFARERDRAIELSPFLHFQTELISLYSLDSEESFLSKRNRDPCANANDLVQTTRSRLCTFFSSAYMDVRLIHFAGTAPKDLHAM